MELKERLSVSLSLSTSLFSLSLSLSLYIYIYIYIYIFLISFDPSAATRTPPLTTREVSSFPPTVVLPSGSSVLGEAAQSTSPERYIEVYCRMERYKSREL